MNAHQRRKFRRASNVERKSGSLPRLVRHWVDLAELPESETHRLEIDVESCNGWIHDKRDPEAFGHYLSTHTFYGSKHEYSTRLLRRCGFHVTCANWDMPNEGGLCDSHPDGQAKTVTPHNIEASNDEGAKSQQSLDG